MAWPDDLYPDDSDVGEYSGAGAGVGVGAKRTLPQGDVVDVRFDAGWCAAASATDCGFESVGDDAVRAGFPRGLADLGAAGRCRAIPCPVQYRIGRVVGDESGVVGVGREPVMGDNDVDADRVVDAGVGCTGFSHCIFSRL